MRAIPPSLRNAEESELDIIDCNGVRLLFLPNQSYLCNIKIMTNAGSASENPDEHGMAHILEHMFFKGSSKYPQGTSISRAANDIGGKLNAYTTYDHTAYYITVLKESFHKGFDILADMYLHPLFSADEFAKELKPILSEFREREDDPDHYLGERAMESFFGPAYHPVIGSMESIQSATVEGMHAFKKRYYGGSNAFIVVTGNLDRSQLINTVQSYFAQRVTVEAPFHPEVSFQSGSLALQKPGIQEAYYHLFFPALSPDDPERYKQDLMNYLLGGNESALLFESIREEKGMSCYGVYSWLMRNDPFSCLGISCGIAPNELDELHREVMVQIDRIRQSKLQTGQLERAKASLRTSIAARCETSGGLSSLVAVPAMRGHAMNPVQEALQALEEISLDDVLDQAQKTFDAPMFQAVMTPEQSSNS
ncbi:MAG: insulinase family protein [Leptospiraceae bacterium]|nr:insulinase family protein [Leptospiraceae bacterium]